VETFKSLVKAGLIRDKGPWRGINDFEIATAEYFDWFNHRRLHGELGYRPPIEVENEFLNRTTPFHRSDGKGLTKPLPNPELAIGHSHLERAVWEVGESVRGSNHCGGDD